MSNTNDFWMDSRSINHTWTNIEGVLFPSWNIATVDTIILCYVTILQERSEHLLYNYYLVFEQHCIKREARNERNTPIRRQRTTQRRSNHPPRRRKEGNTKITTAALLRNSKGWRRTILHPPVTGVLLRRGHGVSTEKPMQFLESLYTSSGTFIVPKWQHICAVVGTTSIDTTSMQELRGTTSWCIGFCLVT